MIYYRLLYILPVIICTFFLSQRTVSAGATNDVESTSSRSHSGDAQAFRLTPEDIDLMHKLFLRRAAVVLRKGEYEVEAGVGYQRDSRDLLGIVKATQRSFAVPLSLRYGLADRAEVSATVPFVHTSSEVNDSETVERNRKTGLGDFGLGFKYVIFEETEKWPAVIVSLGGRAPTGEDPYGANATGLEPGAGHWSVTPGLFFVKEDEPVVLFGGIGYTHQFPRSVDSVTLRPGATFDFSIGMGMAINRRTSISAQVMGAYALEGDGEHESFSTAAQEPWYLRMGVTRRTSKSVYVEPSIAFGLTDDAPDFIFGLSLVYQGRAPWSRVRE